MPRYHDKSLDIDMIRHYKAGKPMSEIATLVGVSISTVWSVLHKNNVETRTMGWIYDIDNKDITTMYEQGHTSKEIAAKYGVAPSAITRRMEKVGIARRHTFVNPNLDVHYFNSIDRVDKAYFLGFLLTDGNVSGSSNRITLCLQNRDIDILHLFRKTVGSGSTLSKSTCREATYFNITSRQWKEDLAKYGIVPRKTFISYMPVLSEDMMPHMLRGIIDGDGCVYTGKRSRYVGLTGTLRLVTDVRDYLVNRLGVYKVKPMLKHASGIYTISWGSRGDIRKIFDYLYKDSGPYYLVRKYEKFQAILQGNTEVSRQITQG